MISAGGTGSGGARGPVQIHGADIVRQVLTRMGRLLGAEGMEPVMRDIGQVVEARIGRSFATETAPEIVADYGNAGMFAGRAWAPLLAATRQRKGRGGESARILRDTGILGMSITSQIIREGVRVGTGVHYGLYHQAGAQHLLPRPFIGIDEADYGNMRKVIIEHLKAVAA